MENQSYYSAQSQQRLTWPLANEEQFGNEQMTKSRLFRVLHLIGWDSGASFLDQSHEEKLNLGFHFQASQSARAKRTSQLRGINSLNIPGTD